MLLTLPEIADLEHSKEFTYAKSHEILNVQIRIKINKH